MREERVREQIQSYRVERGSRAGGNRGSGGGGVEDAGRLEERDGGRRGGGQAAEAEAEKPSLGL